MANFFLSLSDSRSKCHDTTPKLLEIIKNTLFATFIQIGHSVPQYAIMGWLSNNITVAFSTHQHNSGTKIWKTEELWYVSVL